MVILGMLLFYATQIVMYMLLYYNCAFIFYVQLLDYNVPGGE